MWSKKVSIFLWDAADFIFDNLIRFQEYIENPQHPHRETVLSAFLSCAASIITVAVLKLKNLI